MAGGTRANPKHSKTMITSETQSAPIAQWSTEEKKAHKVISPHSSFPTRFANCEILEKMGLLETIEEFFTKMGLSAFTYMDHPTFDEPTIDFFSTMEYTFKNPKMPIAIEGIINFKVKTKAYSISIPDLCEAYGFENKSKISFPKFKGIHFLWDVLASGKFVSNASIKSVRHPVIRYALKLIAHALFGRGETSSTTVSEICFIFQGVKDLLVRDANEDGDGMAVDDDLGNDVNYGCILASYLQEYKNRLIKGKTKSIYIGGTLTPLFVKAGVDLSSYNALPKHEYIDYDNLTRTCSLKCTNDANQFIYLYTNREDNKLECILPSR